MPKPRHTIKLEEKLEEHLPRTPPQATPRPIRLRAPSEPIPTALPLLDGELYLQKMNVVPVLRALLDRDALPHTTFAFMDQSQYDRP